MSAKRKTAIRSGNVDACSTCPELRPTRAHPYRVFISYSHQDRALADSLVTHLSSQGLFPITDHQIRVGEAFSEEIREMIECAHVFMPLVTPSANERLWVQQEIGYATALHVPVCPVAVGKLPSGMAEHIQGIHIDGKEGKRPSNKRVMALVKERLTYTTVGDLVRRARRRSRQGRFECAMDWTDREERLVALTEAAYRTGCKLARKPGMTGSMDRDVWRLRQCTAFGSFSIPDVGVTSSEWSERDPDRYQSQYERRLLRRERQVMEAYMRCFGCDLVLDPRTSVKEPSKSQTAVTGTRGARATKRATSEGTHFKHSPARTAMRLKLVIAFIKDHLDDDRLRVVVPKREGLITTNLCIVGDWFAAEAVVPFYHTGGYERTMFTRHAPTVLNTIDRFEQDLRDHLKEDGIDPDDPSSAREAKQRALAALHECLQVARERQEAKDER